MTWTAVGSLLTPAETNPFSMTTQTVGDFVLLEVALSGSGITTTGVSGGGCTWQQLVPNTSNSAFGGYISVWIGFVTSAGTANVTLTFTGGTPTTIRPPYREFNCSLGNAAISLDTYNMLDNAGGTNSMPSISPAGSGELMWGYCHDISTSTGGSTTGVVYEIDGNGNGLQYDLSVSSPITTVWGDANHNAGIQVLLTTAASVVTAQMTEQTMPYFQQRFR